MFRFRLFTRTHVTSACFTPNRKSHCWGQLTVWRRISTFEVVSEHKAQPFLNYADSSRPVKKFSAFYGTQSSITIFTTVHHSSSSRERLNTPGLFLLRCILILILPCRPRSSKWSLPCILSHQNPLCISLLPQTRHMPRWSHPNWHNHLTFGVEYTYQTSLLCCFLQSPVSSSHTGTNTFFDTSSMNVLSKINNKL